MPRKPRFIHPVRHVRTSLGYTQPQFAKLLGCAAISIQRVENGSLKLSLKLANIIFEATGANPIALRKGRALDLEGNPYSKDSFEDFKAKLSCLDERANYRQTLFGYIELLLIASERAGQDKTSSVVVAVTQFLKKLAMDFNLEKNIYGFLIERGAVRKRSYRVSDLRKFPSYARILGFKDKKQFKPTKAIKFEIPVGWIYDFDLLHEIPVLPKELEKAHKDKIYFLDGDRPIPKEVQGWLDQALYWKIKTFRLHHGE